MEGKEGGGGGGRGRALDGGCLMRWSGEGGGDGVVIVMRNTNTQSNGLEMKERKAFTHPSTHPTIHPPTHTHTHTL